jgi:hypothetical protein
MKNRCFRFTNTEFQNPHYDYNFENWYRANTLNTLNFIDPFYCTSLKNQFCLSMADSFKFEVSQCVN